MEEVVSQVDLYVGGRDLTLANLTGHPTVVLPNGMRKRGGVDTPTSLTFTGKLYGEADLLAVAHAYQRATDFHFARPPLEKVLESDPVKFRSTGVVARLLLRGKLIARDGVQKRVDHLPLFGNTLPHDAFAQITGFF